MAKFRFTLGIGFAGARHVDEIEIDDDELASCETEEERDNLIESYWKDWSSNYIDGGTEEI